MKRYKESWSDSLWKLPVMLMALLCLSYVCAYFGISIFWLAGKILNALIFLSLALSVLAAFLEAVVVGSRNQRRGIAKIKEALSARSAIKKAPGSNLLSIVEFFYSPKTVEEVFRPIIADWRTEYFDALKQNRTIKARWISVRYQYRFISSMGMSKVYSLFRTILSARK